MKRVHLEIVLGTIFTILSIIILTDMTINEEARLERFKLEQRAEQIEFGAVVFEVNCTSCHGEYAQGIVGRAPCLRCPELFEIDDNGQNIRLAEIGWSGGLEDYVVSIVSTGRQVSTRAELYPGDMVSGNAAMPIWSDQFGGPLRIDQIRAVAAFIVNFEEWGLNAELVPTPVIPFDPDDPAALGRVAFGFYGCVGCHTISTMPTAIGSTGPALDGLATRSEIQVDGLGAEEYIRQSILEPGAYVVEGFADGVMPAVFGETISEQDLDNLVLFLLTLEE